MYFNGDEHIVCYCRITTANAFIDSMKKLKKPCSVKQSKLNNLHPRIRVTTALIW